MRLSHELIVSSGMIARSTGIQALLRNIRPVKLTFKRLQNFLGRKAQTGVSNALLFSRNLVYPYILRAPS